MPVIQYIRASVSSPVNQYARILFSSNTGYCVMELSKESCGDDISDISEGAEEKKIKEKKDTTSTSKSIIVKIENHIHSNDENVALRKLVNITPETISKKQRYCYYSSNMSPVEFTSENPYCRFKVVCYTKIPNYRNEDGIVQIIIGRGLSEVEAYKQEVISALSLLFGGNEVVVNEIFAAEVPNKTNFRFYIQQVFPNGEIQRASTTDTFSHMLRASYNSIFKIIPMLTLTEQQMKKYLDTPQRGIDPALWELGKQKNPDPKKLIPVVKVGFQELQKQFKYQEEYGNKIHNSMKNIMDDIRQLSCMQTTIKVTIQNFKLKQTNIMRRVLKLVSAQEVERKKNLPLEEIEDQIRLRLENLYMQLQDLKGCLNELMAQSIKPGSFPRAQRYGLVVDKVQDILQYLKWQQDALQAIVNILKEDIQVVVNIKKNIS
nr:nuclear pore complex protein Nup54-like [Procambarus clarkii]XP_045589028.1 nuclear pore complex protein Nup54-like [Procambarus clarkii]XP_045590546.1 nuclear pore complex protein Nup54-like [Procambarus clarkii]XP_045600949.1 nuclear pore complex protein Nup54-like [Procambarus clarkii]